MPPGLACFGLTATRRHAIFRSTFPMTCVVCSRRCGTKNASALRSGDSCDKTKNTQIQLASRAWAVHGISSRGRSISRFRLRKKITSWSDYIRTLRVLPVAVAVAPPAAAAPGSSSSAGSDASAVATRGGDGGGDTMVAPDGGSGDAAVVIAQDGRREHTLVPYKTQSFTGWKCSVCTRKWQRKLQARVDVGGCAGRRDTSQAARLRGRAAAASSAERKRPAATV
jgi:hypothetical protein